MEKNETPDWISGVEPVVKPDSEQAFDFFDKNYEVAVQIVRSGYDFSNYNDVDLGFITDEQYQIALDIPKHRSFLGSWIDNNGERVNKGINLPPLEMNAPKVIGSKHDYTKDPKGIGTFLLESSDGDYFLSYSDKQNYTPLNAQEALEFAKTSIGMKEEDLLIHFKPKGVNPEIEHIELNENNTKEYTDQEFDAKLKEVQDKEEEADLKPYYIQYKDGGSDLDMTIDAVSEQDAKSEFYEMVGGADSEVWDVVVKETSYEIDEPEMGEMVKIAAYIDKQYSSDEEVTLHREDNGQFYAQVPYDLPEAIDSNAAMIHAKKAGLTNEQLAEHFLITDINAHNIGVAGYDRDELTGFAQERFDEICQIYSNTSGFEPIMAFDEIKNDPMLNNVYAMSYEVNAFHEEKSNILNMGGKQISDSSLGINELVDQYVLIKKSGNDNPLEAVITHIKTNFNLDGESGKDFNSLVLGDKTGKQTRIAEANKMEAIVGLRAITKIEAYINVELEKPLKNIFKSQNEIIDSVVSEYSKNGLAQLSQDLGDTIVKTCNEIESTQKAIKASNMPLLTKHSLEKSNYRAEMANKHKDNSKNVYKAQDHNISTSNDLKL